MSAPEQRSTPAGETGATSKGKEQLKDTRGGVDAASLLAYLDAGWQPFPLPYRAKSAPPRGYTGGGALPVTPEVIADWADAPRLRGCSGVGLRMPDGVIALDVDAYKGGADTLAGLEAKLGPLPETPINTSRDDGSGHRCFRVDPALSWISEIPGEGKLKSGVEILAPTHRYAVVGPSLHKDTGLPYVWGGGEIPRVADLPELPPMWVDFLRTVPPAPYIDTSPERPVDQGIHPYAKGAVTAEIARLEECEMLGEAGPLWDNTTFGVACNLLEFAYSNWSGYTLESVHSLFMQKAPVDDDFGPLAHKSKWDSAVIKVDGGGREVPPISEIPFDKWTDDDEPENLGNARGALHGQTQFAMRLAETENSRHCYVHAVGWHYYDGSRWKVDRTGRVYRTLRRLAGNVAKANITNSKAVADARAATSAAGQDGILKVASTMEGLAFEATDLDSDPNLLNLRNGTLDLRTMELRPHDPADRVTKVCRAGWNPDTDWRTSRWASFLEEVLPDPEVRGYLQRYVGLALLGEVLEHALVVLTGVGRNGKGVAYEAINHALGDYAVVAEPELFLHREGAHPTGQMDLRGARWVVVSETEQGRRLADATVKRLTGGDPIRARLMGKDFVQFEPSHTAAMVTNHLPRVSADDPAMWARLRVIPFDLVVPEDKQDKHLRHTVKSEADAVLAWAVDGLRDYRKRGLAEPEAVIARTAQYRDSNDLLAEFLEEETTSIKGTGAGVKDLHDAYQDWCRERRIDAEGRKAFTETLRGRGFSTASTSKGICWRGLGLPA